MQYKLYRKETDARQYFNTDIYHRENVFNSVPFSQMLRVNGDSSVFKGQIRGL